MADDRFKHRGQRAFARAWVGRCITVTARCIEHWKIKLLVGGIERHEKVEHFVQHFLNALVRTVYLVDDNDWAKSQSEGLAGNKLRLRHRAFRRIDQKDDAVDHRQDAFNFSAKVRVTRCIDDIDAGLFTLVIIPLYRCALGKNGDSAFFFEVV